MKIQLNLSPIINHLSQVDINMKIPSKGGLLENGGIPADHPKEEINVGSRPASSESRPVGYPGVGAASGPREGAAVANVGKVRKQKEHKMELPAEWSVDLDITGMDSNAVKASYLTSEGTDKSLANLNIDDCTDPFTLDSPRSVQACLRLGVQPRELLIIPHEVFIHEEAKNHLGRTLNKVELECCSTRFQHHEQRRRQKHMALLRERETLIENCLGNTNPTTAIVRRASTLFQEEENRLRKLVDANQAMLRQRLTHEVRLEKVKQDREARLEEERARDASKREQMRKDEIQREEESEVRQKFLELKKQLEKREQHIILARKQREYEETEQKRRQEMENKKREIEQLNQTRAHLNVERQQQIKCQSKLVLESRRNQLLARVERADQVKKQFDQDRQSTIEQRKQNSLAKQARMQSALDRSAKALQLKVLRALDREVKANTALKEFERARHSIILEKRANDDVKEMKRRSVYEEAQRLLSSKTQQFLDRQETQERHLEALMRRRGAEKLLRQSTNDMKVKDKLENVARMKKVYEYRKYLTVEKIEAKSAKVREIETEKKKLKEKRAHHRAVVDATRIPITRQTPGPGDYLGFDIPVVKRSPQWKFGLSADNLSMRVVVSGRISSGVAPGYTKSPGPCAYNTASITSHSMKRRPPSYSLPKADRFKEVQITDTPGPSDYDPVFK